jgi:hypothetical protein
LLCTGSFSGFEHSTKVYTDNIENPVSWLRNGKHFLTHLLWLALYIVWNIFDAHNIYFVIVYRLVIYSRQWLCRLEVSGVWRHIIWQKCTKILKIPLKCWYNIIRLYGVTYQKTAILNNESFSIMIIMLLKTGVESPPKTSCICLRQWMIFGIYCAVSSVQFVAEVSRSCIAYRICACNYLFCSLNNLVLEKLTLNQCEMFYACIDHPISLFFFSFYVLPLRYLYAFPSTSICVSVVWI